MSIEFCADGAQDTLSSSVVLGLQAFQRHSHEMQKELSSTQTKLDEKANELREGGNKLADALSSLRHEQSELLLSWHV
jgi:DNA anti-recombination protein RmuC